jgi:riboflavin synthase
MFTGIIEALGKVKKLEQEAGNLHLTIEAPFTSELQIDQSVAHNGICLTVVAMDGNSYTVTAIQETIQKTNIARLKQDDSVNLERCMKLGDRLDGHIVQGHVDQVAEVASITEQNVSWVFGFKFNNDAHQVLVEKGSVTINGVSLTVVEVFENGFSVAIIPFTFEHTNFSNFKVGTLVNIEFDVIGKYVARLIAPHQRSSAS